MTQPSTTLTAVSLGGPSFKRRYGLKYTYLAGSMYKGISSKELVVKMGQAGMMGFLGTGGMSPGDIEDSLSWICSQLSGPLGGPNPDGSLVNNCLPYGANLLCNLNQPEAEIDTILLFLKRGVRVIEASAFMQITPALVLFRLKDAKKTSGGRIDVPNNIIAKISRPEVAKVFLSPAPKSLVDQLVASNLLTPEEAKLAPFISMASDITVEADSGGHTDGGIAYTLMSTMISLRDEMVDQYDYKNPIHVGAAGGLGTPEAIAAAFVMGADYVMTGSINQCTVEAGTSAAAKAILCTLDITDTTYAPAGDMFEIGARVQVAKKGLMFPARANHLYDIYRHCKSLDDLDAETKSRLEDSYFKRSFEAIWEETKEYYQTLVSEGKATPDIIKKAETDSSAKMVLIFQWYFGRSTHLAMSGSAENKTDYQIHCGPAMGAFNRWVRELESDEDLEPWQNRHVDDIGVRLMEGAATCLRQRFQGWMG